MSTTFRSKGKGANRRVIPITPRANYPKQERQNLSLSLINLSEGEGRNLAQIYLMKFNESKTREDKVRFKRHVVQIANLARTMSKTGLTTIGAGVALLDLKDELKKDGRNFVVHDLESRQVGMIDDRPVLIDYGFGVSY